VSNHPTADPQVIIYGTSWCAWCPRAKAHFDQEKIPYTYHDIEAEEDAYHELEKKLGGPVQGVPVLDVKGEIIIGYDVDKINKALAKA